MPDGGAKFALGESNLQDEDQDSDADKDKKIESNYD